MTFDGRLWLGALALFSAVTVTSAPALAQKKPNVVMLMADDIGSYDLGVSGGGVTLGHPTPKIDQLAREGAYFSDWYGQASCTAGRASFHTGRIPIRSALSDVMVVGDRNGLLKETPTIAEFYKKNGYTTYYSGKWHLGDKPEFYPIEHGFDEMKHFAAYFPGVYLWDDTRPLAHPWFPTHNAKVYKNYQEVANLDEWEGVSGQPAKKVQRLSYETLPEFDMRQTESAIAYIKQHAKDTKPFFMNVNFMAVHNPTQPSKMFQGKSRLGNFSDKFMELDYNVGRIVDAIRAEAPDTIVVFTADNGAWQDAYPDAGTSQYRGEKGTPFEAGWRVPGIMWAPGRIPAGLTLNQMMSHMDVWPTTAAMAGLTPPPTGEWKDNNGKPIYFDGIDNSAYVTGKASNSARDTWVYIDGESLGAVRKDVGDDPQAPWLRIAWKAVYTAKDTWLGQQQPLGGLPALYNLTADPFEKYDMFFNGATATRGDLKNSPGRWSGLDNGWAIGLLQQVLIDFDKSIIKYPNIERKPGGASTDLIPNLENPKNPVPAMDPENPPNIGGGGG